MKAAYLIGARQQLRPKPYSTSANFYVESPAGLRSGNHGSGIKQRIEVIVRIDNSAGLIERRNFSHRCDRGTP